MALSARSIPSNYPQPVGTQMLRAEAQRQASMLRQEILTDLLSVLADAREPSVRQRLVRMAETNLRGGIRAAEKAQALWPERQELEELIAKRVDTKPAAAKKQLQLFEQLDKVHHRSMALLTDSFEHIRVILDRVHPPDPGAVQAEQSAK